MKQNFEKYFPKLIEYEGGYCNDAHDPGGPTKYGITIYDVRNYIKKNATAKDVKALTIDQAKEIYKSKYWDALGCDNLDSGVDVSAFDYGVNSGLGRPRKALQKFSDKHGLSLVDAINDERMTFLRALGTYKYFGKGWTARVQGVRAYSEQLATKDNTSGPISGGVIATGGGLASFFHGHSIEILIGSLVAAVLIGTVIHLIRNRK